MSAILSPKTSLRFLCAAEDVKGALVGCDEGIYEWVDIEAIESYIQKPFRDKKTQIEHIFLCVHGKTLEIIEKKEITPNF